MRAFLCALALALCAPAWGDVVYDWKPDSSAAGEWGQLIISDQAWRSGAVQWNSDDHWPDFSGAPVRHATVVLTSPLIDGGSWYSDLDPSLFRASFDIRFVGDGVEGSMFLEMVQEGTSDGSGTAGSWLYELFNTSAEGAGESECFFSACDVTGRWVLDASTVPVPAPGTMALLLAGLATARATRSARRSTPTSRG
jgi:hypothetical protein